MTEQPKLIKENAVQIPGEDFVRHIKLERVDDVHGDGGPGTEKVKVDYRLTFTDSDNQEIAIRRNSRIVATGLYYHNIDMWLDAGGREPQPAEVTGVEEG